MHRNPSSTCLGALVLALTILAPKLPAQDICLPEALGVPALNGAPRWWASPDLLKELNDPRWRGAVSQDFNGEVEFRALHRTGSTPPDTLFLSWQAKIDAALDLANVNINPPTGDQLVVGFKQQAGPAIIIHFGLQSTSPNQQGNNGGVGYAAYTWDGTTLSPAGSPGWITTAMAAWTSVSAGKARWTFQMVVPISAGNIAAGVDLNTATKSFEMFYAFLVKMPSSFPEYRWPETLPRVRSTTTGIVSYPKPSLSWGKVTWGTSLNCAGDVALSPLQIGVGSPPGTTVKFTVPPAANLDTNLMVARPENLHPAGGAQLPAQTIQAQFFIANWGSQPPTAWHEITPTDPTDVQHNLLPIAAGGIGNDIHFRWGIPDLERCLYLPTPNPSCTTLGVAHHCMLVQLSHVTPTTPTPTPTPIVFRNQSTYRNMEFVGASTFRQAAEVSVVGLSPIPDGRATRDMYLFVEAANMPAVIPRGARPPGGAIVTERDTLIVAERDTVLKLDWGTVRLTEGDTVVVPVKDTILPAGAAAGERFAVVRRAGEAGRLTVEEVDALVPTYRVHAYRATGDSLGGIPILEAQTSFGYWVRHDGEIAGWRHRLEGERLVKLAPNYYKIEVANYGTATITTTIEALEPRPFALSLHAGVSIPHGTLNNTHNPGFGITADAEYWWTPRLAVAALLGYHRFNGEAANPDLDLFHASAAIEARVTVGQPSLLVDAGGGLYNLSPGPTDPGVHAGAGLEFDLSPTVSLGFTGRVHTVFTTGSNTTFTSLQAGGRIRF